MNSYDKFLFHYFKLKKPEDSTSIIYLSLIQFLNCLTFVKFIGLLLNENFFRTFGYWLISFLIILIIINLLYIFRDNKFRKIITSYDNISEQKLKKGQNIIVGYIAISIGLFFIMMAFFIP